MDNPFDELHRSLAMTDFCTTHSVRRDYCHEDMLSPYEIRISNRNGSEWATYKSVDGYIVKTGEVDRPA